MKRHHRLYLPCDNVLRVSRLVTQTCAADVTGAGNASAPPSEHLTKWLSRARKRQAGRPGLQAASRRRVDCNESQVRDHLGAADRAPAPQPWLNGLRGDQCGCAVDRDGARPRAGVKACVRDFTSAERLHVRVRGRGRDGGWVGQGEEGRKRRDGEMRRQESQTCCANLFLAERWRIR